MTIELEEEAVAVFSHAHPSISKGGGEIAAYSLFRGLVDSGRKAIFIAAVPEDRISGLYLREGEYALPYDLREYDFFFNLSSEENTATCLKIMHDNNVRITFFHHILYFGADLLSAVASMHGYRNYLVLHEFLMICFNHGQMIRTDTRGLCYQATLDACARCFPAISREKFSLRQQNYLDAVSPFDGFIAPSKFLASRYVDWGLPADKMSVIENGLLRSPFESRTVPSKRNNFWTFGFFGQLNPYKGITMLMRAAELINEDPILSRTIKIRIHGNLIGHSPSVTSEILAAMAKYSFISYLGPYQNDDVYRLMNSCDYVLVPSTWWENSPVVIQESFASKKPVICSNIGGMAEKVTDGISGLHFEPDNEADFVRALTEATDARTYEKLVAGIPDTTTSTSMAQQYLTLLD